MGILQVPCRRQHLVAERQPKELGEIAWIIDRKDRTITEMEETWTTLILPMSEYHFAKNPLNAIISGRTST